MTDQLKSKYNNDPKLHKQVDKLIKLADRKAKCDAELEILFTAQHADQHLELLENPDAKLVVPTKAAMEELRKTSAELQKAIDVQEANVEKEKTRIRQLIAEEYRPQRQKEIQELGKILTRIEKHNERVSKTNELLEEVGVPVSWPGQFEFVPGHFKYSAGLLAWNEPIEKLRAYVKSKGWKI